MKLLQDKYSMNDTVHLTAVPGISVAKGGERELASAEVQESDTVRYVGPFDLRGGQAVFRFDGGHIYIPFAQTYQPRFFYYHVKDHLGNIHVVFNERDSVEQVTHYYPFGCSFGDGVGSSVQDYLYSGKELTHFNALNWYNYGARWYDPTIARWNGVDELAEKYHSVSPYVYCLNNPIRYVDLDGRAPGDKFKYPTLAALDFGMIYNKLSILDNKEYASFIYKMLDKNGNVYYTYAGPARGRQNSVTQKGLDYSNINVEEVKGIVATIHTHADWSRISLDVDKDWNNTFSGDQGNPIKNRTWKGEKRANGKHKPDDISESNRTRTYSYLVTPNGTLKGYDPKSGKITVWSTSLPNSVSVKKTR